MSILIKGMEMPQSCSACPFCFGANNICPWTREYATSKGRNNNCPLVHVPPHGDLIDAQEEMRLMQSCDYDTYDDYNRAFDMLDNAPTIIPAEEGE